MYIRCIRGETYCDESHPARKTITTGTAGRKPKRHLLYRRKALPDLASLPTHIAAFSPQNSLDIGHGAQEMIAMHRVLQRGHRLA